MKKYLVIGNPVEHSLSPKLHNYWIKKNNLNAIYEKKKINENEIGNLILQIKEKKIHGANVTVPFKKKIIPFLDKLSIEAKNTESVNTIYLENDEIIGHNTDIEGFENSFYNKNYTVAKKKVFIIGAGGVVSSIIFALKKMKVDKIFVTNRTKDKAEELKQLFKDLSILNWGEIPNFDIVINATSLGLNQNDKIELDLPREGENKLYYDIIYNPSKTNFLKLGEKFGYKTENGKMMFIYQAQKSFEKWHRIIPEINQEVVDLIND